MFNDLVTHTTRFARHAYRRGVTLVELLVVITIVLMITAATIPVLAPSIQSRRAREATRLITSYFASARMRAAEIGRPVGVIIQRFIPGAASPGAGAPGAAGLSNVTPDGTYSISLALAETPLPYNGDSTTSTVLVTSGPSVGQVTIKFNSTDSSLPSQYLREGDVIRFGTGGPYYYFDAYNHIALSASTSPASVLTDHQGLGRIMALQLSDPTYWIAYASLSSGTYGPSGLGVQTVASPTFSSASYQIFRQPIRSSVAPLQLPEGIAIDLYASGMGGESCNDPNANPSPSPLNMTGVFSRQTDPIISFAPDGSINALYDNGFSQVNSPIYLLVGRREQVLGRTTSSPPVITTAWTMNSNPTMPWMPPVGYPNPPPPEANLTDYNSLWIMLSPQTGQTTVAENAFNSGLSFADIQAARSLVNGAGVGPVTTVGGN